MATRRQIRDDRKYKKKFRAEQWAHDKEVFDYTNEYNNPLNQKSRLVEANLNPALMYETAPMNVGSGSSSTGQPSQMQPTDPLDRFAGVVDAAQQGYDAYMGVQKLGIERDLAQSQIRKNNSEAQLNETSKPSLLSAQTRSTTASASGKEIQNQYSAEQNQLKTEAMKIANKGGNLSVQEKETRLKYLGEHLSLQNSEQKEMITFLKYRIQNVSADTALKSQQQKNLATRNIIDDFEAQMRKNGTSFGDELYQRTLLDGLRDVANNPDVQKASTQFFDAILGKGDYQPTPKKQSKVLSGKWWGQ